MLRIMDGLTINIKQQLNPADNEVLISSTDALRLNAMAVGDHTYFVLQDGRGTELVKYTHVAAIVAPPGTIAIPIDRAQGGTVRKAWPVRSCMHPACCTEFVLREFITQTIMTDIGVC